jgi:WhiB family transcriptional regulator, redox-sensing transcriptional regulator
MTTHGSRCLTCDAGIVAGSPSPGLRRHGGKGRCDACAQKARRGAKMPTARIEEAAREMLGQLVTADGGEWKDFALCAQTDPEAFFPEKGGSSTAAKRVCMGCGVRDQCLEWSLRTGQRHGIWGGLSERERRRLLRPDKKTEAA